MPESEASTKRRVRLGVLRDRLQSGTSQPGDCAEALDLAQEAMDELAALAKRADERDGWRALITENTTHLSNAITVLQQAEPHLAKLASSARARELLFTSFRDRRVILLSLLLAFLLVGGLGGFLSFSTVNLAELLPGGGHAGASAQPAEPGLLEP